MESHFQEGVVSPLFLLKEEHLISSPANRAGAKAGRKHAVLHQRQWPEITSSIAPVKTAQAPLPEPNHCSDFLFNAAIIGKHSGSLAAGKSQQDLSTCRRLCVSMRAAQGKGTRLS